MAVASGVLPCRCAPRGQPQLGFRCFMSTTTAMTSGLGPLGPGFAGRFDETTRRYFRTSARNRFNSVDGLKTIAERINRPWRIKERTRPPTTRSAERRVGDRFRDRFRIRSWCLTSTDSATTARVPPAQRAGQRSPADAETEWPDRAPRDPAKLATRAKNAHAFGIRDAQG
jgi:hypothetical protein